MSVQSAFLACLTDLNVAAMRRLADGALPHLPRLGTDEDVLTSMHMARTQTAALPIALRAYSHRWLLERGLPSQLPDDMKERAERLYPKVVGAVGIAVGFTAPELAPAGAMIRKAMADAVEDCYAAGRQDPAYVRPRMLDAMTRERKALFGRLGSMKGVKG